jgi:putative hydrolase of the HAD superfamily
MTQPSAEHCRVDLILFDFGGVVAEEGFRDGLAAIARKYGRDSEEVVKAGYELVYQVGYVTGRSDEHVFWQALRAHTGIDGSDDALRLELLSRFVVRPWMGDLTRELRARGVRLAILSDQTDWLDRLNERYGFFEWFDRVFNSYHLGKTKKDPSLFTEVLADMGAPAHRALFVDDHLGHIERARRQGLNAIHYQGRPSFLRELAQYCSGLESNPDPLPHESHSSPAPG